MVRNRLSYSLSIVFLLFTGLAGLAGCDGATGATAAGDERSALLVRVDRAVASGEYAVRREFVGRVEATRQSRVGFELGGELNAVLVDEGDDVSSGAILARLDTERLAARLAEAEAALDQALSASEFAARSLERSQVAASFEGISDQELDLAVDGANAARAGVSAAQARVNSVEVDIGKSVLRAPFDAVVTARHLDEGQIVSPGQPVLDLQEAAAPEVRIGISGDLARDLEPGQARTLVIDGREVDGTVRAVLPVRDPATRTVDVIFTLVDDAALPGDLARLPLDQVIVEDGFWLPISALAEGSRGLWTAYVAMPIEADGPGTSGATHYLESRAVEILYEDTQDVYVRGALSAGEWFVTGGLTRVVPNQQVRIETPAAYELTGSMVNGS